MAFSRRGLRGVRAAGVDAAGGADAAAGASPNYSQRKRQNAANDNDKTETETLSCLAAPFAFISNEHWCIHDETKREHSITVLFLFSSSRFVCQQDASKQIEVNEGGPFVEFSLCLSRACLGKMMHHVYI